MNVRRLAFRKRPALLLGLAAAGAVFAGSTARADSINIQSGVGNEGLGEFTGTITYTHTGNDMGVLVVDLLNTSDHSNGGFITAFVFNVLGDATLTFVPTDDPDPTQHFNGYTNVNGQDFGIYEYGAGIGDGSGNFGNGGSVDVSDGLGVGVSGTFTWNVVADDAAFLSADDFMDPDDDLAGFVVRFQGFNDGGSDKVPGLVVLIPTPPAVWMGLAGLVVVGVVVRRRMIG